MRPPISTPEREDGVVCYGNWEISYNPPPIPSRNCDWQFCHKDFDGAEDACDNRYGHAASLLEAMGDIDDREDDLFWERGCDDCPLATPDSCLKVGCCPHRDDKRARLEAYEAQRKAVSQ